MQHIDFGQYRTIGTGYRLAVAGAVSQPFAIAARPFRQFATDAPGFFYQQPSAVPILARYVQRPDLTRAAGHPREVLICFAGNDQRGVRWPGDAITGWM